MKTGIGHIAICQHGSLGIVEDVREDSRSGTVIGWYGRKLDGSVWQSLSPVFLDSISEKEVLPLFESRLNK